MNEDHDSLLGEPLFACTKNIGTFDSYLIDPMLPCLTSLE